MAKQTINIGASPNDGTGTPLRTAFDYCNLNFTELYTATGPSGNNIVVPGNATITGALGVNGAASFNGGALASYLNGLLFFGSSGNIVNIFAQSSGIALKNNSGSANLLLADNSGVFTFGDGAGGTRMTLNATGLGVGVVPSLYKFELGNGGSDTRAIFNPNNAFSIGVKNGSNQLGGWIGSSGNNVLTFSGNDGTMKMTIDNPGNVGIGVTPSAWGGAFKAVDFGTVGGIAATGVATRFAHNSYNNGTNFIYKASSVPACLYELAFGEHRWSFAPSGTAGNAITFTQAMTLDASGRLLVGSSTSGTSAGDGIVKLGTYGHCISQTGTSIASGSSVDLTVVTSGAGYQGFLSVANTQTAQANTRTQTTYSVFGRGSSATFTQIATENGSLGAATFTVTVPSNGVIRITNTSGAAATISAQFFGGVSA